MKRKTLVKVMAALLVILLIVLGIVIGGKKMNSDDVNNPDAETETEEQEEGIIEQDGEFIDVFEEDENEVSLPVDDTKKEEEKKNDKNPKKEEQKKEESSESWDDSGSDEFRGIELPMDEWE